MHYNMQISQMAKKLSKKLQHEKTELNTNQELPVVESEERQLSADEV